MATLDSTITALKKGVTSLTVKTAVTNIEGWQKKLDEADAAPLKTISKNLGELKDLLEAKEPDGKEIGKLLAKLGRETVKASEKADDDGSKIKEMGELLVKASGDLS